jgi:uncharacterized protein YuzE
MTLEIVQIDKDVDALYIKFAKDAQATETLELNFAVHADIDAQGNVIGVKVANFSDYGQLELPNFDSPVKLAEVRAFSNQFV